MDNLDENFCFDSAKIELLNNKLPRIKYYKKCMF